MSSTGIPLGKMDTLKIGDIIQMNTLSIPIANPPKTFSFAIPFPPRDLDPTIIRHSPKSPNFQYYRVEKTLMGTGSSVIPDREHYSRSSDYILEDYKIYGVMVEPISYNTPLLSSQPNYTKVNWWINITHMSVNQNGDGMPLRTIKRLVKVDPPHSYVSLLSNFQPRRSNLFRPSELDLNGKDLCQRFEYEEDIQKNMPPYSVKTGWLHNPRGNYEDSSDEDEDDDQNTSNN